MSTGEEFEPCRLLRNPHLMTVLSRYWGRAALDGRVPQDIRSFQVAPDTRILGYCHWQEDPRHRVTLVVLHGLEGCSESLYIRLLAAKTWARGWNVVRLNQRNCGGTEHLTPTLYNTGLSADYASVCAELATVDRLSAIWLVGYSMGGNLVLKCAAELGRSLDALKGVAAICPSIDAERCVAALEQPKNWLYQRYFLGSIRKGLRRKAMIFPGRFDLAPLAKVRTLREFDDAYTAPDGGYANAADYYTRSSAVHQLPNIEIPTIIIAARDDPIVPFSQFEVPEVLNNPAIRLLAPAHGGHCGFIQRRNAHEDRRWAENRILEFIETVDSG